jgi:Trk-type K+ transport system membrane component
VSAKNKQKKKKSAQVMEDADSAPTMTPLESPRASLALAGTLTWAYIILLLLGWVVFQTKGTLVLGNEMSKERAAFVVANAGTLTGFQLNLAVDQYHWPGHWMMLVLTVGGTLFSLIVGGIAVARIVRLPYSDFQIVLAAIGAEAIVILLGAFALARQDQSLLANAFQAASAFGNSGVWMGIRDGPDAWRVHGILLPLAIAGGLGLPVLLDIGAAFSGRRRLSIHSTTVLWTTAAVYVIGLIAIFVLQWLAATTSPSFKQTLAISSATSINARTGGLPILPASQLARPAQWLVILLMAIGASSGGAGGGIKTTSLAVITGGIRNTFAGKSPGRVFGIASVWIMTYCALVLASLLLLMHSEPDLEPDRLLFIVVSAASNVGMSHDRMAIAGWGQYTLCGTMLLGRLLPLVILWWTAMTVRDADVAVG